MGNKIEWTSKEDSLLKKYGYRIFHIDELSKLNQKPQHQIYIRLKKLKIKRDLEFSKNEIEIVKKNYKTKSDSEIAELLFGRTRNSVKRVRTRLKLLKGDDKKSQKVFPKNLKDWFLPKLNKGKKFENLNYRKSEELIVLRCTKNKLHIFNKSISNIIKTVRRHDGDMSCPYCSGRAVHKKESFGYLFPKLSKCFSKENKKASFEISINNPRGFLFECRNGHKKIKRITRLTNTYTNMPREDRAYECEVCEFKSVYSNKKLLSVVDRSKHSDDELKKIPEGASKKKLWFQCPKVKTHLIKRTPFRVLEGFKGKGYYNCSYCLGIYGDPKSNSVSFMLKNSNFKIEKKYIEQAKETYYLSRKIKFKFICPNNHLLSIMPDALFKKNKPICQKCVKEDRLLKNKYPKIFLEIHKTKNQNINVDTLTTTIRKKIWWQCEKNPDHVWLQTVNKRVDGSGCHLCREEVLWNKSTLITFIRSIENYISTLTQSEVYLIFQQTGFPYKDSKANKFIKDYLGGKLPQKEIDRFTDNKESEIDKYFTNLNGDQEIIEIDGVEEKLEDTVDSKIGERAVEENTDFFTDFPTISVKEAFDALEYCLRSSDQEAVEYLLESAKNKLWRKLFNSKNKVEVIKQIEGRKTNDEYDSKVKKDFLDDYYSAEQLTIPKGYNFTIEGKITPPNLMQLRTASRVVKDRSVGNWSGTGAGKTLSAILASRVIDSKLTLVCCPNAVVNNWKEEIETIFPGTHVQTKDFEYQHLQDQNKHKFLVLNFEAFQQQDSDDKVMELLEKTNIEFVVIDEIHFAKQKDPEKMSKRKRIINSMIAKLRENNPQLAVLGMSATPVINNLQEGIGLIEMITGETHQDLESKISEENCMKLHQRLMTNGLRMKIPMNVSIDIKDIEVDCSEYIDEFKALQNKWFPLNVEQITTRAKIKEILKNIKPKTLIYTHYRQDIDKFLYDEITKAGWSVGFHTGDDKSGLDNFREGTLDVLIGTSTIGTGVNGLQNVCSNLIINSMPWTNAEFEQLIGRVYRQGQKNKVNVIIPLTTAEVNGQDWSWCKSRYERIKFKKTIGDAVIDGQLPNQNIRTQAQVVQDIKKWLDRLTSGEETIIERAKIKAQFIPGDKDNIKKRIGTFGDFSKMNARWYNTSSEKLHERLSKDRVEWDHYHEMYEENRKSWTVVPMEEMIKVFSERSDYVIGDFGCGKAQIHDALKDNHVVHSFDHVAYNQNVVACDFSHTPLDNETLDHAIFCLSFMGNAIGKYLLEASRTLKLDGKIHIIEPTKTFKYIQTFEKELAGYGFGFVNINSMSERFTYIRAEKTGEIKNPNPSIKL